MTGTSNRAVTVERGIWNGGRKCMKSSTISSRKATSTTPAWTSQNRPDLNGRRNLPMTPRTRPGTARIGLRVSALVIAETQQLGRDGTHHCLGARAHPELGVDVVAVPVHGARADTQLFRNLPVVQARREKRQDRKLTLAQVGHAMLARTRGHQQPSRETRLKHARATGHGPNSLDQFLAGGSLAQVTRCPGLQGAADVLVLVVRAHHQDPNVRMIPGEPAGDLDAVHARKPDVHQQHVRAKLVDQREGDLAGAGVTNDLQVGVHVENLTSAIPVQSVIIDHHHSYHLGIHSSQATRRTGRSWRKSPTGPCVERALPLPRLMASFLWFSTASA